MLTMRLIQPLPRLQIHETVNMSEAETVTDIPLLPVTIDRIHNLTVHTANYTILFYVGVYL